MNNEVQVPQNTAAAREAGVRSLNNELIDQLGKTHSLVGEIECCLQDAGVFHPEPKPIADEAPKPPHGLFGQATEMKRLIANLQSRLNLVANSARKIID